MKRPKMSDLEIDIEGTKSMRKMMAKAKKLSFTITLEIDKKDFDTRLSRLEREVERLKKKILV